MNSSERISWKKYFMLLAVQVSSRGTCNRKKVGAVIVRDKTILSTGYNGSIRGLAHCDDEGHLMENGHCVRTVHAEANAVAQAAKNGVNLSDSEIFITASPCWTCFKLLANSGITKVTYGEFYQDKKIFNAAKLANIELEHIPLEFEQAETNK